MPNNCLSKLVVSILIIASFTACVKQNQQGLTITKGVLSVGVEAGYPPMEYYDSGGTSLIGFDIDMTRAIAQRLGLNVNFIDTAWDGIFAGLDAGRYDIAVNITILPERQRRFNFTNPYIDSSMTIVTLKNPAIKIETPQDIAGLRVAFQGDTTAQYFTERLREQGLTFTSFSYDKIINCFNDLRLGRVDLIVVDNIAASHYAGTETDIFEIVWEGPSDEYIAIALKKGNDTLTKAINEALDELFKDGTMLEISNKYFNRDLVTSVN